MREQTSTSVIELSIAALSVSIIVGFADAEAERLARRFLLGRISEARLPRMDVTDPGTHATPDIWIRIAPSDRGVDVAFGGLIESPTYSADVEDLHWDFSKVLNAAVMERVLERGLAPLHAASLDGPDGVVLFPGASGAGKSSLAYVAAMQGHRVLSSELVFIDGSLLLCGNRALTIDRAAIELFGLPAPPSATQYEGSRLMWELPPHPAAEIRRVVFPRVHNGELHWRKITPRRARMLLFENLVTQLPVMQLLSQETWPLWRPPARERILALMGSLHEVSLRDPLVIEGPPGDMLAAVIRASA